MNQSKSSVTGPAKKVNGSCTKASQPEPNPQKNGSIAEHTVAAVRALGVLCFRVSDMLACIPSNDPTLPSRKKPSDRTKGWAASLDPASFIDEEDEAA